MIEFPMKRKVGFGVLMSLMVFSVSVLAGGIESDEEELKLEPDKLIKFKAKDISRVGIYNPHFWTENNERSTRKDYDLWKKSDVYIIEWPGNITIFDSSNPLLKWTKPRAKYLENHCFQYHVGMEMRAYAYKYLFLTWGPYRFTMTSAPPLTIPGNLLHQSGLEKKPNTRKKISVTDFEFVNDALLITTLDGAVIIVSGLSLAYSYKTKTALFPLKYSVAKGITSPVNKLVTQHCCLKLEENFCPHGETVVAYLEYSSEFTLFVSSDGGLNFKKLHPKIPKTSSLLHSVLSFPDIGKNGKVLVLHGTETKASLDSYSMSTGALISSSVRKSAQGNMQLNGIHGLLQASRIGEEMSMIIWDQCNVWYSSSEAMNFTKAIFYIHGYILNPELYAYENRHSIVPRYCNFGANSSFAIGTTGKLAILDSNNVFFLGIDTKSTVFQLAAIQVDMSLVLPRHSLSIVPNFDLSQHPKLIYPPRYLEVPDKAMLGKNYHQRLGIRLLPKTVFPSEFITVFYEENARLPKKFKNFALRPCQTSSLSVNRSITQKTKYYTFSPLTHVNFTIVFKSRVNTPRQLNYEPKDVNNYLEIRRRIKTIDETTDGQYWYTYEVNIKPRSSIKYKQTFLINFYTKKALRCNFQPSYPVHLRLDSEFASINEEKEDNMSKASFIHVSETKKEFGTSYKLDTCSSCVDSDETCKKEAIPTKDSLNKNEQSTVGLDLHSGFS